MDKIDRYKKGEKKPMKTRSVSIRSDQDKKIVENRLNFSKLVRDLLDAFFETK